MSPRVQAKTIQKRCSTPRIPFLLFRSDLILKALMKRVFLLIQSFFIASFYFAFKALRKRIFLFDQGFFIARLHQLRFLIGFVVFKISTFKKLFPQYYICFPTSV